VSLGDSPVTLRSVASALLTGDGLADPYPVYRELRERSDEAARARIFVDHARVREVLVHPALSSDRAPSIARGLSEDVASEAATVTAALRSIVAFRDPPGHTRIRRILTGALSSRAVSDRAERVAELASRILDRMAPQGEGDLVDDLFLPLPARVVSEILGIPEPDHGRFARWANDIVMYVGSGQADDALAVRMAASLEEMQDYLGTLIARRRAEPEDDLLSAMIHQDVPDDERLTDHEIATNALFLMTAGHETATNMLSNGLLTLLRHPQVAARVREDDTTHPRMVEEVLRFESPVQMTARIAQHDLDVAGAEVAEGEAVLVVLGAANRDATVFDDPDRFTIDRTDLGHVAFGHGPHWCIGGNLARHEARVVIPMVLRRLEGLELTTSAVDWQPTLNFRGPRTLPVRWAA
jgi:cytochrome P450